MSRVRGPTSALTEFLREQGIRPTQSRRPAPHAAPAPAAPAPEPRARINMSASLDFDEDEDEDEDGDTALVPGQQTRCAVCDAPFSVTRYTSGRMCVRCRRREAAPAKAQPAKPAPRRAPKRRAVVEARPELPTLQALCINTIAHYIDRLDRLGTIGQRNTDAISRAISKNRRLTNRTLRLFLDARITRLALYDCSALDADACASIAALAPNIAELHLQYCGQLDDAAVRVWARRLHCLRELELYGPFLVRRDAWCEFLAARGAQLSVFRIRESPRFDRACVEALVAHGGARLTRVGLAQIAHLDDAAVAPLAQLALAELDVSSPGPAAPGVPPGSLTDAGLVPVVRASAAQLEVLRVARNWALTDAFAALVLPRLTTLVLDETSLSDAAYAQLIGGAPQLAHVSLTRCRAAGERTLDALGARALRTLSVNSTGASAAALHRLARAAPPLEVLDLGFVRSVDDGVLGALGALPLRAVYVFGCSGVSAEYTPPFTLIGRERAGGGRPRATARV